MYEETQTILGGQYYTSSSDLPFRAPAIPPKKKKKKPDSFPYDYPQSIFGEIREFS